MRGIKEILILIRENRHLHLTYSRNLNARIAGLCDIGDHLYTTNIMDENEMHIFREFMLNNELNTEYGYWWPGKSPERWEWLDEQIEKI